jgi:N-acetylmuramic acid 6-phosphate etherase
MELGYTSKDLFIGVTEGGETPFVIGATLKAATISQAPVYFLFCNPIELLRNLTQRTHDVLSKENIVPLSFPIGPMALSGSTRLQSCTVMQLALGGVLFNAYHSFENAQEAMHETISKMRDLDLSGLAEIVQEESEIYKNHGYVHFVSDAKCSLTVLTDTTERSPTFSLYPFENVRGPWKVACWNYLSVEGANNSFDAWKVILGNRTARTLEWSELEGKASLKRLLGFDVSNKSLEKRRSYLPRLAPHKIFKVKQNGNKISFGIDKISYIESAHPLARQTLLKIVLNALSTIVMGRVGRYQSNIMTWVRPSNNKLIDRTIRNAQMLLEQDGRHVDYMDLAHKVFELLPEMHNDRSLVIDLYKCYK